MSMSCKEIPIIEKQNYANCKELRDMIAKILWGLRPLRKCKMHNHLIYTSKPIAEPTLGHYKSFFESDVKNAR